MGLRVSAEEEIQGLDIKEHGLASAYDGFAIRDAVGSVPTPMGTSREFTTVARPSAPAEFVPELPKDGVHKLTKVVILTVRTSLRSLAGHEKSVLPVLPSQTFSDAAYRKVLLLSTVALRWI